MLERTMEWASNIQINLSLLWQEVMFDLNNYLQSSKDKIDYLEKVEYNIETDEITIYPEWISSAFPDEVDNLKKDVINFIKNRIKEKIDGATTLRY